MKARTLIELQQHMFKLTPAQRCALKCRIAKSAIEKSKNKKRSSSGADYDFTIHIQQTR